MPKTKWRRPAPGKQYQPIYPKGSGPRKDDLDKAKDVIDIIGTVSNSPLLSGAVNLIYNAGLDSPDEKTAEQLRLAEAMKSRSEVAGELAGLSDKQAEGSTPFSGVLPILSGSADEKVLRKAAPDIDTDLAYRRKAAEEALAATTGGPLARMSGAAKPRPTLATGVAVSPGQIRTFRPGEQAQPAPAAVRRPPQIKDPVDFRQVQDMYSHMNKRDGLPEILPTDSESLFLLSDQVKNQQEMIRLIDAAGKSARAPIGQHWMATAGGEHKIAKRREMAKAIQQGLRSDQQMKTLKGLAGTYRTLSQPGGQRARVAQSQAAQASREAHQRKAMAQDWAKHLGRMAKPSGGGRTTPVNLTLVDRDLTNVGGPKFVPAGTVITKRLGKLISAQENLALTGVKEKRKEGTAADTRAESATWTRYTTEKDQYNSDRRRLTRLITPLTNKINNAKAMIKGLQAQLKDTYDINAISKISGKIAEQGEIVRLNTLERNPHQEELDRLVKPTKPTKPERKKTPERRRAPRWGGTPKKSTTPRKNTNAPKLY